MKKSFVSLAPLALAALAASSSVACSGTTQQDQGTAEIESALETANGSLSAAAEAPAFGESKVAELDDFKPVFADTTDMTREALSAGAKRFHVAVFWGHLPSARDGAPGEPDPQAMDFSGSISVSAGAIGLSKTLRFDAKDRVEARTDPKSVSFVSHTLPHVDGLLLDVVVPAGGDAKLHVDTASLKTDIDLASLESKAGGAERLPDGRNGLAYVGFADAPGVQKGFVFGRWHSKKPQLGVFRGRVADEAGLGIGHVKGIWGHAPKRDANVFFGKYIGNDGAHRGLFGGTYGQGAFEGVWGVVAPAQTGKLEGFYSDGYEKDDGRGVFMGRWSSR